MGGDGGAATAAITRTAIEIPAGFQFVLSDAVGGVHHGDDEVDDNTVEESSDSSGSDDDGGGGEDDSGDDDGRGGRSGGRSAKKRKKESARDSETKSLEMQSSVSAAIHTATQLLSTQVCLAAPPASSSSSSSSSSFSSSSFCGLSRSFPFPFPAMAPSKDLVDELLWHLLRVEHESTALELYRALCDTQVAFPTHCYSNLWKPTVWDAAPR